MKVTRTLARIDTTNRLTVAFDVSSKKVDYYSELDGKIAGNSCREKRVLEGREDNTTRALDELLRRLDRFAAENGYHGLHVVCEPTGVYSNGLLRTAHRLGHTTAYVAGESVAKARVIENNETGKSDTKDPRVIFMLSKMGKELVYRQLPALYQRLRDLNRIYDQEEQRTTRVRCRIHHLVNRLFFDFPMGSDFIFKTHAGAALMKLYTYNPYRIVADGPTRFQRQMRKTAPAIQFKTLEKLWSRAQACCLHQVPCEEIVSLELCLQLNWEEFQIGATRKHQLRTQIEAIATELIQQGQPLPQPSQRCFNLFFIGCLAAEMGPLDDFPSWRAAMKYAGLNLRVRQCGRYKGKTKLSKKGRGPVRKILGKLCFSMAKRTEILGSYYHRRKAEGRAGTRIMAIMERKLLRMFFAMGIHRAAFNEHRFQHCQSQYRIAA